MSVYNHSVVCTKCKVFMRAFKTGVKALELDCNQKPYHIYFADLYKCPKCGLTVVTGFGNPIHVGTLTPEKWAKLNQNIAYVIGA